MRPRFLIDLPPGTRFVVAEQPSLTGILVRINHCTAYVAYDQAPEVVRIVCFLVLRIYEDMRK